jgi:hypothetical protein
LVFVDQGAVAWRIGPGAGRHVRGHPQAW